MHMAPPPIVEDVEDVEVSKSTPEQRTRLQRSMSGWGLGLGHLASPRPAYEGGEDLLARLDRMIDAASPSSSPRHAGASNAPPTTHWHPPEPRQHATAPAHGGNKVGMWDGGGMAPPGSSPARYRSLPQRQSNGHLPARRALELTGSPLAPSLRSSLGLPPQGRPSRLRRASIASSTSSTVSPPPDDDDDDDNPQWHWVPTALPSPLRLTPAVEADRDHQPPQQQPQPQLVEGAERQRDRKARIGRRTRSGSSSSSSTGLGLPKGWREARDAGGRRYYYNKRLKQSTWQHPEHPSHAATGDPDNPDGVAVGNPTSAEVSVDISAGAGVAGGLDGVAVLGGGVDGRAEETSHHSEPKPLEGYSMLQMYPKRPLYSAPTDRPPEPEPELEPDFETLELLVEQPGFFGVSLDEVMVEIGGTYVCVTEVQPGSLAAQRLPELTKGMYQTSAARMFTPTRIRSWDDCELPACLEVAVGCYCVRARARARVCRIGAGISTPSETWRSGRRRRPRCGACWRSTALST
jgi:hypothetical protein